MQEIEGYLAEEIAINKLRGMTEEEADRHARIKCGNTVGVRESLWQQNTIPLADVLLRDVRHAGRTLFRSPGFSLIAIGVMALCIGAATSLFTVVRSVLLRQLPFRDPDRLVMLYEHFRDPSMNVQGFNYNAAAPADYYDWRERTHGFEDIAAWRYWRFNLTGVHGELPELVEARGGSWNLFPLLDVHAVIGRTFAESEDRTDGYVAMLTWDLFERRFGSQSSIIGKQIHLDGEPYTVIGVLPQWFTYPNAKVQIWVPYASGLPPFILKRHDFHWTFVMARLRPDVGLANALSRVEAVQQRLHLDNLNAPVAEDVATKTIVQDLANNIDKPLIILLCAAVCMLLIGCLNLANLMVARSTARQKEFAVRSALGAQRGALIRAQLTESLLISIAGGATGALLSLATTKWLVNRWRDLPSAQSVHVDGVVLAFACALVLLTAVLGGLLPAIVSTGKCTIEALKASSRSIAGSQSRTMLRKTLLTVEIATTVVLLIGAGLLLKTFWRLWRTDVGCTTENVLTMGYSLPQRDYDSPAKVNAFNERLLESVRAMPGVRAAALGSVVPGAGSGGDDRFTINEHPPLSPGTALPDALYRRVSPEYFRTLQIPLSNGRFFTTDDRAGRPRTIIISRQLARQYFPGEDPLGKHLHVVAAGNADYRVVGIVADTLDQVGQPSKPTMYFPVLDGENDVQLTLLVRTASAASTYSVPVQRKIAKLDPALPVTDAYTMRQIIDRSLGSVSLSASLVLTFALLSLLLASVGLYGVLSYLAIQRTGEIGVRLALGAQREQVARLMVGDGMRPALYGLALGLAASVGVVRLMQSMLYGTRPLDPTIFVSVAATLLGVATLACLVPAWRASRIDPMEALRTE
jgi:putative ABC transport system permease protein